MTQAIAGELKRQIFTRVTATGDTPVVVAFPGLKDDSIILASLAIVGGTPSALVPVAKDVSAGTVSLAAASGDTSQYDIIYLA